MKIVLIIHHPLHKNAGAPGVVLSLANEFRALGHDVTVISHDPLMHLPERLRILIFPFYCFWTLRRRHGDADVIDASSGSAWLYFLLGRKRSGRALHVSHSHGLSHVIHDLLMAEVDAGRASISWKYPFFNGSMMLWQDAESFRRADLALFLNQSDHRYAIEKLGVSPGKAQIVPNGLSGAYLQLASAHRRTVLRPRSRVVQVGSYIERKGVKTTAEAMIEVLRAQPQLHLSFLGTCVPAIHVLRDYPSDLHSRVHVTPFFENDRLPELLAQEDIFLMPSRSEGFPLAPMEAMACGLVPIVTNIPGPTEYIHHRQNGLLIRSGDAPALAAAVTELMQQDDLYWQLREAAIETASALCWTSIAAARLSLYERYRSKSA